MKDHEVDEFVNETLKLTHEMARNEIKLTDLPDWDSFRHMELVSIIESEFKIIMSSNQIVQLGTVGDMKNMLKKLNEK